MRYNFTKVSHVDLPGVVVTVDVLVRGGGELGRDTKAFLLSERNTLYGTRVPRCFLRPGARTQIPEGAARDNLWVYTCNVTRHRVSPSRARILFALTRLKTSSNNKRSPGRPEKIESPLCLCLIPPVPASHTSPPPPLNRVLSLLAPNRTRVGLGHAGSWCWVCRNVTPRPSQIVTLRVLSVMTACEPTAVPNSRRVLKAYLLNARRVPIIKVG